MDRSWKTKLLRRLAPVIAATALAGCSGRSDSPAVVERSAATVENSVVLRVDDVDHDFLAPQWATPAVVALAAIEREYYEPRLRRLPTIETIDDGAMSKLPAVDVTAALAALSSALPEQPSAEEPAPAAAPALAARQNEPLQVPAVDLSEALAAIVRQATPETAPPSSEPPAASAAVVREDVIPSAPEQNATTRSRWSDHLASSPEVQIPSWPIARLPLVPPSTTRAPSRLASHGRAEVRRARPVEEIARLPEVPENRGTLQVEPVSPLATSSPAVLGAPQFVEQHPAPPTNRTAAAAPATTAVPQATAQPPLPTMEEVSLPSAELMAMRAVNGRAEAMIHHAFGLARRSAHYSAKAELVEVLRLLSQALDMRDGATEHSDALAKAFRALDEASDFQPRGSGLESNLNIAMLVAGHQTPVLKDADLKKVTALAALQKYYTYAQQQLIVAGGGQPTASASLYGLGRLQSIMNGPGVGGLNEGAPQAMVFHQSAVMIDGANYKAANELGVLLARYRQYDTAREMLIHSVRVSPQAQSWQNLATVHARLGEHDLARKAMHEARLVASGAHEADSPVRWVPAEALARSAPQSDDALISPASSRTVAPAEPGSREVRGIMKFLPWTRSE